MFGDAYLSGSGVFSGGAMGKDLGEKVMGRKKFN
jgi:hypothetical protein